MKRNRGKDSLHREPLFAVPSLTALIEVGYDMAAAVTQPDKPRGRGLATLPCAVKELALRRGIRVLEPRDIRDEGFISELKGMAPDLIAVVAYGRILPESILGIPPRGCVNLHASILPRYRGAAPVNWAIINGDKETGVSTMLMDAGMDTGPVLLTERVAIHDDETAEDLAKRLSTAGAKLLAETIGLLAEGGIHAVAQDDKAASYAPMLKKDGRIDWAKRIRVKPRGSYPWPRPTAWKDGRDPPGGLSGYLLRIIRRPGRIERHRNSIIVNTGIHSLR